MNRQYSVLMSVYKEERPDCLWAALDSIRNQSLAPTEIVLVCDGPLTDELEQVLEESTKQTESTQEQAQRKMMQTFQVSPLKLIRLEHNVGLGSALSEGLKHCRCEWVARMDSDDIAAARRCELQMDYLEQHPDIDVLSGTVAEFVGNVATEEEARRCVLTRKTVPESHEQIAGYIKLRNPLNHPCVMFRKFRVLEAGGYQVCPLFEDYDLWVRMFLKGCRFANLTETLLYMRVNDMHRRRGGLGYARAVVNFWKKMYERGMISYRQYVFMVGSRVMVSLLPNRLRKLIYEKKLRN